MGRPRVFDDEQLLVAAEQVLAEEGLAEFTLERVAQVAGGSAANLIKRFGSKRDLMLALNRRWVASIIPGLEEATRGHDSAFARLRAAALWGFEDMDCAASAPHHLAALAVDLQDARMRELLAEGWRLIRHRLSELAAAAIDAGELRADLPVEEVGRALFAAGEGIRISWSVQPEGSLTARAAQVIDLMLAGWVRR